MKNNSKRICALLLAIVMCIGCVVPVFAETTAHDHAVACPGEGETHTMTNAPVVFVKTVAPQCGVKGYDYYECETCKAPVLTNWTEIGNGSHTWGEWTVSTQPTCDKYGVMTRACTNDGCKGSETIDEKNFAEMTALHGADLTKAIKPLEHKNADGTSAITSTRDDSLECKDGIPAWVETCQLCKKEWKKDAIPGSDCDRYVAEILVQPNCYETGLALVKCTNCSYEAKEVIVFATGSLAHNWDASKTVVSTKPTCGTAGSGTVYCATCQQTLEVVKNQVTVTYVAADGTTKTDKITLDPSFGFAATGVHSFTVPVTGSPADCDSTGILDHKKCANCDAVSIDGTAEVKADALVIDALGHKWEAVEAVPYGCEKDGVKAHFKCSVCEALSFNKTDLVKPADVVDPAKHDYDLTNPVADRAPTCTKYGFWFYGCGVCGTPALEADGSNAGNATVPTEAIKAAYGDKVTGEWVSNGVLRISMLPHDTTKTVTNGDCTTATVTVYECNDCDYKNTVTEDAPGHDWKSVTVDPNCQNGGYTFQYCQAEFCGWTDTDGDTVVDIDECVTVKNSDKDGGKYDFTDPQPNVHKWDSSKAVITTSPTCTDKGIALDWCALCGANEEHSVDALGHNSLEYVGTVLPSCVEDGYLEYQCSRCHASSTKVELNPADLTEDHEDYATNSKLDLGKLGHDVEGGRLVHKAPTCADFGTDTYYCVREADGCQYYETKVLDSKGEFLYPALNHTDANGDSTLYEETTLPKCDPTSSDPKVGIAGYVTELCTQCNHSSKVKDIPFVHNNAEHHPGSTVNKDTVWHDGIEYADAVAADAAAVAAGATEANGIYWPGSCDRERLVDYSCPNCQKTFYAADSSMVGEHAPKAGSEVAAKPAGCTTDGNLYHYVCEKCANKILVNTEGKKVIYTDDAQVVIKANGHTWTDVKASAPTCTAAGTLAYSYCACGAYTLDKNAEKLVTFDASELDAKIADPAKGHAWGTKIPEVPATCAKAGTKAYYDCANCDAISLGEDKTCTEADLVILAINHVNHMVDSTLVEAECLTPGYQYHYCNLCGYEYVDNYVYAQGHKFGKLVEKVDPDCDSTGFGAYYECSECKGKYLTNDTFDSNVQTDKQLTIPATGIHTNKDGGTILDKCTDAAADRHCVGCDQDIPASHTAYAENTVAPTCTEYGYTAWVCVDCKGFGKTDDDKIVEPTGHNYQWVETLAPGQYTEGQKSEVCVAGNGSAGCGDVRATESIPALGGIAFSYEIDNAIVSGAEYVNGGQIKLTIKYNAANVDLANIALRLNYDANVLEYVSGEFKCSAKNADGEAIFAAADAKIGGATAGFVVVSASTYGFGENPANETLNGSDTFAVLYFNVKQDVVAGTDIAFEIATTGLSASQVLKADNTPAVYYDFGSVPSVTTKALADINIDGNYTSSDEVEFLNYVFASEYAAEADINQDGRITSIDYELLLDLLLGNKTYEQMCAEAQKNA